MSELHRRSILPRVALVALLASLLGACGEPTNERRIERLEDDVHDLEERVEEMESKLD